MIRRIVLMAVLLLTGCGGYYNVPRDEFRQTVRTLGVLPLLVDDGSVIAHPERDTVLTLLRRHNAQKHLRLIEQLKEGKGYFDVRPVDGDPRRLYRELATPAAYGGEEAAPSFPYVFNARRAADLAQENVVDALLIVVLRGETRTAKRWDRRHLTYLEAPYNDIVATAAVVLPSGETVWEYPDGDDGTFLQLQYPDFDEAFYNRTDNVRVKFISTQGLDRTMAEAERSLLGRADFPALYRDLFDSLAAALNPGLLNPFRSAKPPADAVSEGMR